MESECRISWSGASNFRPGISTTFFSGFWGLLSVDQQSRYILTLHSLKQRISMESNGFQRILLDSIVFQWISVDSFGFNWIPTDFVRFNWIQLNFIDLQLFLSMAYPPLIVSLTDSPPHHTRLFRVFAAHFTNVHLVCIPVYSSRLPCYVFVLGCWHSRKWQPPICGGLL